jgi:hypothetical protein
MKIHNFCFITYNVKYITPNLLLNKFDGLTIEWAGVFMLATNGGNKARLAYPNLSSCHRTSQPNGLYCMLSAAFY